MVKTNIKILVGLAIGVIVLVAVGGGAIADRLWGFKPLDKLLPRLGLRVDQRILTEVISRYPDVAEKISPRW